MSVYLTTKELADHLGLSVPTVQRWRIEGNGPPFIKQGNVVRYDREEIEAWIEDHKIRHAAQWGA